MPVVARITNLDADLQEAFDHPTATLLGRMHLVQIQILRRIEQLLGQPEAARLGFRIEAVEKTEPFDQDKPPGGNA